MESKEIRKAIRAIDGAYHDRDDYPPFELSPFKDRATYHAYIVKILKELL